MVFSQCQRFSLQVRNAQNGNLYREIKTNRQVFIIAEREQEFQLVVQSSEQEFYGIRVFIDGQMINTRYTVQGIKEIKGFPQGGGIMKAFRFCMTENACVLQEGQNQVDRRNKLQKQCITVKIYETFKQVVNPNQYKRRRFASQKSEYQPMQRSSDKKMYNHALTVDGGTEFQVRCPDQFYFLRNQYFYDENRVKNYYQPRFDDNDRDKIAEITLHYTDYFSALTMGIIQEGNIKHSNFIPQQYIFKNSSRILSIVVGILKQFPRLYDDEIVKKFKQFTERDIKDVGLFHGRNIRNQFNEFLQKSQIFSWQKNLKKHHKHHYHNHNHNRKNQEVLQDDYDIEYQIKDKFILNPKELPGMLSTIPKEYFQTKMQEQMKEENDYKKQQKRIKNLAKCQKNKQESIQISSNSAENNFNDSNNNNENFDKIIQKNNKEEAKQIEKKNNNKNNEQSNQEEEQEGEGEMEYMEYFQKKCNSSGSEQQQQCGSNFEGEEIQDDDLIQQQGFFWVNDDENNEEGKNLKQKNRERKSDLQQQQEEEEEEDIFEAINKQIKTVDDFDTIL